jgi:hypothetical protein
MHRHSDDINLKSQWIDAIKNTNVSKVIVVDDETKKKKTIAITK